VFPIRVLDQLAPDRYSVVTCGVDRLQHVAFELQVAEVDGAALHYRFSPRGDHAVLQRPADTHPVDQANCERAAQAPLAARSQLA
jgi:hypothetical protein